MKNIAYIPITALFLATAVLTACQEDMENYENKVFDSASPSEKVNTMFIKADTPDQIKTLTASIAQPMDHDMTVVYRAAPELVSDYNSLYGESAIELPAENYEISDPIAVISRGAVTSTPVEVKFRNFSDLDVDAVYVLPVTIASSEIPVLESNRTSYFVIKGAALINVVADMARNYTQLSSPGNCVGLASMSQLTVEMLVYPRSFDREGMEAGISTLLGNEDVFLLRLGDSEPSDQIQLATSNGNLTDPEWKLETNKWTFMTFTYDSSTGAVEIYFNGEKKGQTRTTQYRSNVNWDVAPSGKYGFFIGRSYSDVRWFDGEISEVRVWNRILSREEMLEKNHFYSVSPQSNGLVAYWKFNEGAGRIVKDYANGYDMVANSDLKWVNVELPAKN
ncbi:MAG: DUF1735 and LamG domain-containing protein [Muribaculaceae bacterium]|nr:DUF1735 and LamG domain-containing protein [Muribaculaceae bacterium]